MSDHVIDLTKNPKQKKYFNDVFISLKSGIYKYFAYGGAIRGGKTYVTLFILIILCKKYPNSKWVVVRKDLPKLQKTTIPSLKKLLRNSPNWEWHNNPSNIHVTNIHTGASIFFQAENLSQDPELDTFLGLECNGFFLEQAEELGLKMWSMGVQRAGSWYIDPMPPPFIFTTFNPTQKWPKKKFNEPFIDGKLNAPYYFLEALPNDNPFVTKDQWEAWQTLDSQSYDRMIKGDWSAFSVDSPFFYAFDEVKHVSECIYDNSQHVDLSFDFNVDPITCLASQEVNGQIRIIKEFRLSNSDIYQLCDMIKVVFPSALFRVTGDATGRARSALASGNLNYYSVIKQCLGLSSMQMKQPNINPSIRDSRVLCNSILQNFNLIIDASCEFLIEDMKYVEVNDENEIDKTKDKHKSHLADCLRYLLNSFHRHLIRYADPQEPEEQPAND